MRSTLPSAALGLLLAAALASHHAKADVITFDQQGLLGPSQFSATYAQDIHVSTSVGPVTLSGGAILTSASGLSADPTSVYATGTALQFAYNPLTVTFPTNISNFFVDVYNLEGTPDTFTLTDNLGYTATETLPDNSAGGPSLLSLPALGNTVTITAGNRSGFDFAIDNIGFNEPTPASAVPEPASFVLLSAGLAGLRLVRRSRA